MRRTSGLCAAVLALTVLTGCTGAEPLNESAASTDAGALSRPATAEGPYPVAYVVDGDTLKVDTDGGEVTVRVIGIDTPETRHPDKPVECFGPEATAHAEQLLDGADVWLEEDPTQDTVDQYGRRLAYVWTDTTTLFNLEQITAGYAYEYTYDQVYKYQDVFRAAEKSARHDGAGLWSEGACLD